jgi:methylmalonyl-CoA mutase N-terminal domain/subunit
MAAVMGGTQSLHTDSYDEALALPTEDAVRVALRTQQIAAHESGVAEVADPLGGSHYVEWMTDELERQATEIFQHLDDVGHGSILEGVVTEIESGWFQGRIAEAAYDFERRVNDGRRVTVGVNAFTEGGSGKTETLYIGPEAEEAQLKRLTEVRRHRDDSAVTDALDRVTADAAVDDRNLMPALLDAARAHATVGETVAALRREFGTWEETAIV